MTGTRVGFIGTGIMGAPMARHLIQAGYRLSVHNRTPARAEPLIALGANWAGTPGAAARNAEFVISVVPDSPDVERVYFGPDGVCQALARGAVCIDMSTVSPDVARQVAQSVEQRGGAFLDAPVSGGKTGAEAGTLSIMVGGTTEALERARPVLMGMGKTIVHCGPAGAGQLTKLCNQILCGLNLLAVSEALTFARRAGLDLTRTLEAVSAGAAGSWALSNLGPRMVRRDFAPMFMIDLQQKDLRIALASASSQAVSLPGTALVNQLLAANQALGEGRDGTQALVKTIERLAGINVERAQ